MPLAQRSSSSKSSSSSNKAKSLVSSSIPAGAIGQNADGSFIIQSPPSNAIGQNADGSYILAPGLPASSFTSGGSGAGLPQISPSDIVRGAAGAYREIRDDFIQPLIKANDFAGNIVDKYAPNAGNLAEFGGNIVDKAGDLLGGWDAVGERISQGGGFLTTPQEILEKGGEVVGNTAANIVKPLAPYLLIGLAVYAFASN